MLDVIPVELLDEIVSHLRRAQDVRSIALCCKTLHARIQHSGWRTFARTSFPSLVAPWTIATNPKDEVKGLVALSKSWDRLSLLGRDISEPFPGSQSSVRSAAPGRQNNHTSSAQDRQSMGFVPVIDSHEEIVNERWGDRKDVVIFAAGSRLSYRYRVRGRNTDIPMNNAVPTDQHGCRSIWSSYREANARDGIDDWTAVKISRPENGTIRHESQGHSFAIIAGTASGKLSMIDTVVSTSDQPAIRHTLRKTFVSPTSCSVRAIDISPSQRFILSGTSGREIIVFDTSTKGDTVHPHSSVSVQPYGYLWTAQYLSDDLVLVGTGSSRTPLQAYSITPSGLLPAASRTWSCNTDSWVTTGSAQNSSTSVFTILPLPNMLGSSYSSQVFLSGLSSAKVLLHDMRSPRDSENSFFDPHDDSAIYSLLSKGRERIIAGTSRHATIKFFDLRMAGGRCYSYKGDSPDKVLTSTKMHSPQKHGYGVFLRNQITEPTRPRVLGGGWWHNGRRLTQREHQASVSPVYSLSSPASFSPTIFVGLEERVVEINVADVFDRFPDPVHHAETADPSNPKGFWDQDDSSLNLAAYPLSRPNHLLKQSNQWIPKQASQYTDMDDRWS